MYFGKKSTPLQWEKVLAVMISGEPVNKEILEKLPEMKGVPLYRLSSYVYHVKLAGGVVKVIKNGRNIDKYQLVNIDTMKKYLENREKLFATNTVSNKVQKLSDLSTPVVAETASDELVVEEIV